MSAFMHNKVQAGRRVDRIITLPSIPVWNNKIIYFMFILVGSNPKNSKKETNKKERGAGAGV